MSNKTKLKLTVLSLTVTVLANGLTACGNSKWHEVARNTGDVMAERQTTTTQARDLRPGMPIYTNSDRLIGRETPDQNPEDSPIILDRNDELIVVDPTPRGQDNLITAIVVDTNQEVLVPPQYVATAPVTPTNEQNAADRYFMIQNIATEKVRVYENCVSRDANNACVHKMILETDMTAGEDTPDQSRRSILGSYRISQWFKFYEDNAKLFPSWYAPNSPALPAVGSSIESWMSPSLLPSGSNGVMRGSFGWYTAHIQPNSSEQWTHGTFGWGADGGKFIADSKEAKMDLRSQGCTRVENRAIAFMREIMPAGAKIIKIYAKEALNDSTLAAYKDQAPAKFDFILTKDGVRSTSARSSARLHSSASAENVLERGSYTLDQTPDAAAITNIYQVPEAGLRGVFNVDEGRVKDYVHPTGLRVGGHADHRLPNLVIKR